MAIDRILVLGATGMMGRAVALALAAGGHFVRVLARDADKARRALGEAVEIVPGDAADRASLAGALEGCDGVHVSLPKATELTATRHVLDLASGAAVGRVTYVSGTSVRQEHRFYDLVDVKMRCEEALAASGVAHVVFRPTWAMETLRNFVRGGRAILIESRNPPPLHFVAAADFGRIVAASYDDDHALGRRLTVHGPEAIRLPDAIARYAAIRDPAARILRLTLRQARLLARLTFRAGLLEATRLIAYFDRVGEPGDPAETNALYGAPATTLEAWCGEDRSHG